MAPEQGESPLQRRQREPGEAEAIRDEGAVTAALGVELDGDVPEVERPAGAREETLVHALLGGKGDLGAVRRETGGRTRWSRELGGRQHEPLDGGVERRGERLDVEADAPGRGGRGGDGADEALRMGDAPDHPGRPQRLALLAPAEWVAVATDRAQRRMGAGPPGEELPAPAQAGATHRGPLAGVVAGRLRIGDPRQHPRRARREEGGEDGRPACGRGRETGRRWAGQSGVVEAHPRHVTASGAPYALAEARKRGRDSVAT